MLRLYPRPTESETAGMGPGVWVLTSLPDCSHAANFEDFYRSKEITSYNDNRVYSGNIIISILQIPTHLNFTKKSKRKMFMSFYKLGI